MRISLKTFAKLDKARTFGNTFVELNRGGIALVGQPMDLAATVGLGGGVDKLDQLATHAAATLGRLHQQVLQVAGIFDAPVGAAVDEVTMPTALPSCQARAEWVGSLDRSGAARCFG